MKKILTVLLLGTSLTASAQYQLSNNGFEDWATQTYDKVTGEEPLHWSSFITGNGKLKGTACTTSQLFKSEDVREGSKGKYCAEIKVNVLDLIFTKVYAQGNLTTGRITMGSTSASNPGNSESENIAKRDSKQTGNYNYTDLSDANHNQTFTGRPDKMTVYVKYTTTGSKGKIAAYLHSNAYYQDPLPKDGKCSAKVIASAVNTELDATSGWQKVEIPVVYASDDTPTSRPSYALVSFATSATPGSGKDGDCMLIDDVVFVYNSELESIKYNNTEFFEANKTAYTVDDYYDESKLTLTSNAKGGSIKKDYNAETGLLTVTVLGDDDTDSAPNRHTYTIQFKVEKKETKVYKNALEVQVNGVYTPFQEDTPIKLIHNITRDSYSFLLENFSFSGFDMGDIQVDNLTKTINPDGSTTYTGSQDIYIDMIGADVTANVNATVDAQEKMTATIFIPENDDMLYNVNVTFAPKVSISDDQSVVTTKGTANVIMTRTFKKGWNTICLPFSTTAEALGATKVQELTDCTNDLINFKSVEGNMEWNTPYLIYFDEEKPFTSEKPFIFAGKVTNSNESTRVLFSPITMIGNYKANFSMKGYYGVVDQDGVQRIMSGGEGATLGPCRAYFQTSKAGANGMLISFDGQTTGITAAELNAEGAAEDAPIYNLQGVRVNHLTKGVYIKGGKKIIVK